MLDMPTANRAAWPMVAILAVLTITACSGSLNHQGPIRLISNEGPAGRVGFVAVGPTVDAVRAELSGDTRDVLAGQPFWAQVASKPGQEYLATLAGTRCSPLSLYSAIITSETVTLTFEFKPNQCGGAAAQSSFQPLSLFSLPRPAGTLLPNQVRIVGLGPTTARLIGRF